MAVNLLAGLLLFTVSVVSLNLEPPEFLGAYTDDPARWPYGGCVEVSKIYPSPGSHLLPPPDGYAKDWNLTITVVFSRPVTKILWNYDIRTWLYPKIPVTNAPRAPGEVQSCAKQACLMFLINGELFYQKATTAGPTERGKVFSDEYQFTYTVPAYVKDHMSEVYFAFDGGWMYSPVYKFITNADVVHVPYFTVRYLPPRTHTTSNRPPERDSNYWVNLPSTCATHGGLIHRPFIFSRTKREQQLATGDSPKLLTELTDIVKVANKEQRKLRLHYQIKQPGVYTVELPGSVKLVDKEINKNVSFSVAIKSIVINFTSPRLYIPVAKTDYVFDYQERNYVGQAKWNAYWFTRKIEFSEVCRNNASFDCNMFQYSRVFPIPSLHTHQVTIQSFSGGYRLMDTQNYDRLELKLYHQYVLPEDKQFYLGIPEDLYNDYEFYSSFKRCTANHQYDPNYCYTVGSRNLKYLIVDPYWKVIALLSNYIGEPFDHFMLCDELPRTIYKSLNISLPADIKGMLHFTLTGSLYEKNMAYILPLFKYYVRYHYGIRARKLDTRCQDNFKRTVGKWGKMRPYIEYGNMYRLHVSEPPSSWSVQQTMNARYIDKNGHQHTLNATIVSVPEHIKKAVRRYAVLTNVQPSVNSGAQRDTRLRGARESYPLEKAVFVPIELTYKRGCRTLKIARNDISKVLAASRKYGEYYREYLCDKPPDDCTGLPFDSLDRFPLIPPFNVLDLIGPVDVMNVRKKHHRRALYYRDDIVNDLFILYSPNSYYTGVVEIGGVEVKEPEFVKKSCNNLWEFSADRYEITRGHVMATITNKGEGGGDVMLTVRCTPKLGVFPEEATVWVDPDQTKTVRFTLAGYPEEAKESSIVYKCSASITVDLTPFSSAAGKTFPTCELFIPAFGGYFLNPCESYLDHDITYYYLPKEFADNFSLKTFLSSKVGREYELVKIINVKLVKYHMIRLSCENKDVLALTEDHLITSSMSIAPVGNDINLVYSIDKLLQEKVYIFMRKSSNRNAETRCLLTLISIPYTSCSVLARKYITLTEADIPVATALQWEEEAVKKPVTIKTETSAGWYKLISEREEVLSAILVCTVTSLILIVLIVTGNTALLLYDKQGTPEQKLERFKTELQLAKQEHEEAWNSPQMYLKSGILGPHYVLQQFKATDSLDTSDIKMLKLSGVLRYREKELPVVVEYIDKIIIKKSYEGNRPDEVWLKASTGMYLLKQNYVSEEYKEEFESFLQRYTVTREY